MINDKWYLHHLRISSSCGLKGCSGLGAQGLQHLFDLLSSCGRNSRCSTSNSSYSFGRSSGCSSGNSSSDCHLILHSSKYFFCFFFIQILSETTCKKNQISSVLRFYCLKLFKICFRNMISVSSWHVTYLFFEILYFGFQNLCLFLKYFYLFLELFFLFSFFDK